MPQHVPRAVRVSGIPLDAIVAPSVASVAKILLTTGVSTVGIASSDSQNNANTEKCVVSHVTVFSPVSTSQFGSALQELSPSELYILSVSSLRPTTSFSL